MEGGEGCGGKWGGGRRADQDTERRAVDVTAERRTFEAELKCAAEGD